MGKDCHRCGSPLDFPPGSPAAFCPACGSPQFLYDSGNEADVRSTEVPPPPQRKVEWKHAINAAATFAAPVGLLCSFAIPVFPFGFFLWATAGSVAGVWLYRRRSLRRRLDGGAGTRIGTILGLMAAAITAALNAGAILADRYIFHSGNAIDNLFEAGVKQGLDNFNAQMAQPSPDQVEFAAHFWGFWGSPDGHAAMTLLSAAIWAIGMVAFAAIGGALGARIFSGPNTLMRNS
jgi:hypothetical protein